MTQPQNYAKKYSSFQQQQPIKFILKDCRVESFFLIPDSDDKKCSFKNNKTLK